MVPSSSSIDCLVGPGCSPDPPLIAAACQPLGSCGAKPSKTSTPDDDSERGRELADEGSRLCHVGNGAETSVNGRTCHRYSLRRWEGEGGPPPQDDEPSKPTDR